MEIRISMNEFEYSHKGDLHGNLRFSCLTGDRVGSQLNTELMISMVKAYPLVDAACTPHPSHVFVTGFFVVRVFN
jgi:hypothetical protein